MNTNPRLPRCFVCSGDLDRARGNVVAAAGRELHKRCKMLTSKADLVRLANEKPTVIQGR